ncbi:MAG: polynucleotide adenylyltransferase PcnB [Proteobacteria bacterium]|nr:polynucleotide adenylyltransferase PcnB [Pseudomonadota bacterium]
MIRAFLKKVGLLSDNQEQSPLIIPRKKHGISRKDISENALKVLYRLNKHGYGAYLVGGGVRDLLLGLHPKDFDVATDATPDEVRRIFKNCRLIGRRFRLAHVYFGHDIVEVATFRGKDQTSNEALAHSEKGMILRDNVYGTIKEDVWRRDFTINALYYNIKDFSVVDYVGGYADLKAKKLRIIGSPKERYREDPVRMLRAIRFACKVGFEIPKELSAPMKELKELISHVSSARLFEEMMKMFHSGAAKLAYENLLQQDLFDALFPATAKALGQTTYPTHALLTTVFENTDKRIKEHKTVTPAFIVAALLWHPICLHAQKYVDEGMTVYMARMKAIEDMLREQIKLISMPKRIVQGARDIWLLQMRLGKRQGKRALQLIAEPRFRAAFDFLEVRAHCGEPVKDLATWWKTFIDANEEQRRIMIKALGGKKTRRKPKRKKAPQEES